MSVRSGNGTAPRSSARDSKTHSASVLSAVPKSDLRRLVEDYRKHRNRLEAQQNGRDVSEQQRRVLNARSVQLTACISDIEDLIAGKEHPADRRGQEMRERSNG